VVATIFDPKLLQAIPQKQLSFLLSDHLLMAFESLISNRANAMSDVHAKAALEHGAQAIRLNLASSKDLKAVMEFCIAGGCLTLAIATSGLGPGSAAVAALNSRFGIPKAWASAVLLPHLIESLGASQGAKLVGFAQALGEDAETINLETLSNRIAAVLRRIIAKLEQPARLRDFKLTLDNLREVADLAMTVDFVKQGLTPINHNQMLEILRKAY
jgi:alcohol dehydrogenase class IV